MKIRHHKELRVWQDAMDAAMMIFQISKNFPVEERYSLVDRMRRSSRSVAANLSEAWRTRKYRAAFTAKLSDAEAEAAETQTWIEFCRRCGCLTGGEASDLEAGCEKVISQIAVMSKDVHKWVPVESGEAR